MTKQRNQPELYVSDQKLIVISQPNDRVEIENYQLTMGKMPEMRNEQSLLGYLIETRRVGDFIYVITNNALGLQATAHNVLNNYYARWDKLKVAELTEPLPETVIVEEQMPSGLKCHKIVKQVVKDFNLNLALIYSLNINDANNSQVSAVLGSSGHELYMSQKGMYLLKSSADYGWSFKASPSYEEKLTISEMLFDEATGEVIPTATGQVDGRIKDRWAVKDYGDALVIATTTGQIWDHGENKAQNHLWVLQTNVQEKHLDVVAAVKNFGPGEDIRSVRYVGNTAYIVTFKKTDPLFAIDLTNLKNPQILGELKIPGFSVYMHPVAPGRMVGIGFDALDQGDFALYQGIQVSLFDTTNPKEMSRLDNHILGARGSFSEVTGNHHAFYYDAAEQIMAVPVVTIQKEDASAWDYNGQIAFSGAILYRVGDKLEEIARLSHADLIPEAQRNNNTSGRWWQDDGASFDINRVLKVDGQIITLSQYGIKVHEANDPSIVIKTIVF